MNTKDQNELKPPVFSQTIEQLAESLGYDSVAAFRKKLYEIQGTVTMTENGLVFRVKQEDQ